MIDEIVAKLDIHTDNALRMFGSKDDEVRTTAKILTFRMLYGGSAYAFFMDNKMPRFTLERWEEIVFQFWSKYRGLKRRHEDWIKEVYRTGRLVNPSGRWFKFHKQKRDDGSWGYSRTQIVNYPVQSLATGDIIPLAVAVANSRVRKLGGKTVFVNQVHDSLIYDCPESEVEQVARVVVDVMNDLPSLIHKYLGFEFNVPLTVEAKVGTSWGNMEKLKL